MQAAELRSLPGEDDAGSSGDSSLGESSPQSISMLDHLQHVTYQLIAARMQLEEALQGRASAQAAEYCQVLMRRCCCSSLQGLKTLIGTCSELLAVVLMSLESPPTHKLQWKCLGRVSDEAVPTTIMQLQLLLTAMNADEALSEELAKLWEDARALAIEHQREQQQEQQQQEQQQEQQPEQQQQQLQHGPGGRAAAAVMQADAGEEPESVSSDDTLVSDAAATAAAASDDASPAPSVLRIRGGACGSSTESAAAEDEEEVEEGQLTTEEGDEQQQQQQQWQQQQQHQEDVEGSEEQEQGTTFEGAEQQQEDRSVHFSQPGNSSPAVTQQGHQQQQLSEGAAAAAAAAPVVSPSEPTLGFVFGAQDAAAVDGGPHSSSSSRHGPVHKPPPVFAPPSTLELPAALATTPAAAAVPAAPAAAAAAAASPAAAAVGDVEPLVFVPGASGASSRRTPHARRSRLPTPTAAAAGSAALGAGCFGNGSSSSSNERDAMWASMLQAAAQENPEFRALYPGLIMLDQACNSDGGPDAINAAFQRVVQAHDQQLLQQGPAAELFSSAAAQGMAQHAPSSTQGAAPVPLAAARVQRRHIDAAVGTSAAAEAAAAAAAKSGGVHAVEHSAAGSPPLQLAAAAAATAADDAGDGSSSGDDAGSDGSSSDESPLAARLAGTITVTASTVAPPPPAAAAAAAGSEADEWEEWEEGEDDLEDECQGPPEDECEGECEGVLVDECVEASEGQLDPECEEECEEESEGQLEDECEDEFDLERENDCEDEREDECEDEDTELVESQGDKDGATSGGGDWEADEAADSDDDAYVADVFNTEFGSFYRDLKRCWRERLEYRASEQQQLERQQRLSLSRLCAFRPSDNQQYFRSMTKRSALAWVDLLCFMAVDDEDIEDVMQGWVGQARGADGGFSWVVPASGCGFTRFPCCVNQSVAACLHNAVQSGWLPEVPQ